MNILITGATSGIGKQVALNYLAQGHRVFVCGRNQEALAKIEADYPQTATTVAVDVSELDSVNEAFAPLPDLDIVILNAGVCEYLDINKFEAKLFERVFKVNVMGTMNCVEALLPKLGSGSRLVIVGSTARLLPFTRAQAYGGSKAALQYIARSLEVDLAPRGVRVITVSPGFVETPMTDANDFDMPMQVSVEFAADAIINGIRKEKTDVAFPTLFSWFLKLLSRLPQAWQVAISKRLKSKQ